MLINGVDLSTLAHKDLPKYPDVVPGRVVHIDADFLAYMVSADDEKSLADMKHNAEEKFEEIRKLAGATSFMLHLTGKGSDKGSRYDFALLKEYQSSRKEKPKPRFLEVIKNWMVEEHGAVNHMTDEADDGMSSAAYKAAADGVAHLCVIASKDKDLTMVPGYQLDWDTGELTFTEDNYGFIYLDDSTSTKKIKGRGWKFFWSQMLTGDPADTISGLPKMVRPEFLPGKPKACGPVMAYSVLENVKTNKEAFTLVRDLYKECGDMFPYVNYRDGSPVTAAEAFLSEAKLLWMRRNDNPNDVIDWMTEECL